MLREVSYLLRVGRLFYLTASSIRWAPDGLDAYNPAFDVTPAELIAGIITEAGVARQPFAQSLAGLLEAP